MLAGEFIRFLWGSAPAEAPGTVTIWRSADRTSLHVPLAALREPPEPGEDEELFEVMGRDNLYASPGLRRAGLERGQRGTKKDVIALGAFALDIDVASPAGAHKANNDVLPRTDDEVLSILEVAPVLPSIVIHSGFGYQPWWVFDEPVWIETAVDRDRVGRAYKAFQEPFIVRAKELGFHIDSTATIDHVFRLPNTKNAKLVKKGGETRDVKVIDGTYERYADLVPRVVVKEAPEPKEKFEATGGGLFSSLTDLGQVRYAMKRLRPGHERKVMMDAVLAGESFAERGERDDAMYAVASTIAWFTAARKPGMTAEVLAELLRPSLTVWASEPDADKTIDEEMEKAVTKFESAIENRNAQDEKMFEDAHEIRRGLRMNGEEPDEKMVNGTARFYSLIQTSSASYVWNFAKADIPYKPPGYYGPVKDRALYNVCKDLWHGASEGYVLKTFSRGEEKNKSVVQILDEYGSAALNLVGHLALQESHFDIETRTFHEAMCPMRVKDAERDPDIEEWLALFGSSNHEKLLDWVATIPRLEEPNSALYLEGVKDVGKDLFASGVARLWRTSGASLYDRVSEKFNKDMFECPFIWLNEGVDGHTRASSSFIRRLVSATGHACERKGFDVQPVLGSIRLYIAANNENVLLALANEDLSEADLDAVAQRFLHIRAAPEAAAFLESKKDDLPSWVKDDRIARHVLHLAQTRTVKAGRKFLVDGEQSQIHQVLLNRGDKNEVVLEWLVNFLSMPERITREFKSKKQAVLAGVGGGGIFVNTKAFTDNQSVYRSVEEKYLLLPGVAGRILSRLSGGRQKRFGDHRYHAINPVRVFEWSERTQIGDIEKMRINLAQSLELKEDED